MTKATTFVERSYRQRARGDCHLGSWLVDGVWQQRTGYLHHPLGIVTIYQWRTDKPGECMMMTLIDRDGHVWSRWWDDAPSRAACDRRARAFIEQRCGA